MQSKATKFIIAGTFLTLAVIVLAVTTLKQPDISLTHFTPSKLLAAPPADVESVGIQVDGFVAEGSERFDPNVPELRFKVRDPGKPTTDAEPMLIEVIYRAGLKPDSFKEGQGVVVEGRYDPATKTMEASKLMTKCPSKYEASGDTLKTKTYGETPDAPSPETAQKPEETP